MQIFHQNCLFAELTDKLLDFLLVRLGEMGLTIYNSLILRQPY